MQETIEWVPVSERLPDDDETVMKARDDDHAHAAGGRGERLAA